MVMFDFTDLKGIKALSKDINAYFRRAVELSTEECFIASVYFKELWNSKERLEALSKLPDEFSLYFVKFILYIADFVPHHLLHEMILSIFFLR